jgi:DNA-directed RNA polymerase subunit RPC12/RpoP
MTAPDSPAVGAKQFKCVQCGARLEFAPGTDALACPYCGKQNELPKPTERVRELELDATLRAAHDGSESHEILTVRCKECGGESTLPPDVTSAPCPFCGSSLVTTAESRKAIKPGAVLPFHVTRDQAQDLFRTWIAGLWFAPNDVKRYAQLDGSLNGVYVPYWTYDARTTTDYVGQRGDAYYVTETYTEVVNGKEETRTREVRHIRWTPASGTVEDAFDDLLVRATTALPTKYLDALEPWDLQHLVPYRDEYLAGFRTDSYQIDLAHGFEAARRMMEPTIERSCRADIGGDEQRVEETRTDYHDLTFKHLLFPVWISAFRYRGKIYRLLVNARTGEVQGERPWSFAKIALAVLAVPVIIGLIALISSLAK